MIYFLYPDSNSGLHIIELHNPKPFLTRHLQRKPLTQVSRAQEDADGPLLHYQALLPVLAPAHPVVANQLTVGVGGGVELEVDS